MGAKGKWPDDSQVQRKFRDAARRLADEGLSIDSPGLFDVGCIRKDGHARQHRTHIERCRDSGDSAGSAAWLEISSRGPV
jgi:hypothetical protein